MLSARFLKGKGISEINVPAEQRKSIAALDVSHLGNLLDQSLREERLVGLSDLRLYDCGDYIVTVRAIHLPDAIA